MNTCPPFKEKRRRASRPTHARARLAATMIATAFLAAPFVPDACAAATAYTDEATYLAALASGGYTAFEEGFEQAATWGLVRTTIAGGTSTAASVTSAGVTWTGNNAASGVTTTHGAARGGSWGFTQLPHGNYTDPANPITDGFILTTGSALVGAGGWFSGQGTSTQVEFILDTTTIVGFNGVVLGSQPRFLGVIETAGFLRLEVRDREGTFADQNFVFADDFSFGVAGAGTCGDGVADLGESCDDGNTISGDCCSATCGLETGACEDGDACTVDDACTAGSCSSGVPLDCGDSNPCTDDSCNPASGCTSINNSAPCSDGNACTDSDQCAAGICTSGPASNCDDGNLCTDDSCDPATGCASIDNSTPCDDGSVCTTLDVCSGGACVGTSPLDCNDGNLCTDDSCAPATGCANVDNAAPCDDGDACTTNDACAGGSCVGGAPLDCDDGNVCTTDACFPAGGCHHDESAAMCDDGNACTTVDVCSGGECLGAAILDCDDGNICTTDTCDTVAGCSNEPNTVFCNDGDSCTVEDRCDATLCTGTAVSCETAGATVAAGGTVTTDSEGDGATTGDPIETTVFSAIAGRVDILEVPPSMDGIGIETTLPTTTPMAPHRVVFRVDASLAFTPAVVLAAAERAVRPCADASGTASPAPCVLSRSVLSDGDLEIVALTSRETRWRIGAAATCKAAPLPTCLTPGALSFLISNKADTATHKIKWRWRRGDAVSHTELGTPQSTTQYALCTYDYSAGVATLVAVQIVPAGLAWISANPRGYRYFDVSATSDGVRKLRLRADDQGMTAAKLKAVGAGVPMPIVSGDGAMLEVDPILHAQLVNSEGLCWSGEFPAARLLSNLESRLRAKMP